MYLLFMQSNIIVEQKDEMFKKEKISRCQHYHRVLTSCIEKKWNPIEIVLKGEYRWHRLKIYKKCSTV